VELEIYAYKCKRCGHVHYPYRTVCKQCKANDHNEFSIVPVAKDGTLLTFTTNYTLPGDYETVSITLGVVELSDGLRMMGQLAIDKPRIGMKVRGKVGTVRQDEYNKFLGMIFSEA
jgi:hypothetical protein